VNAFDAVTTETGSVFASLASQTKWGPWDNFGSSGPTYSKRQIKKESPGRRAFEKYWATGRCPHSLLGRDATGLHLVGITELTGTKTYVHQFIMLCANKLFANEQMVSPQFADNITCKRHPIVTLHPGTWKITEFRHDLSGICSRCVRKIRTVGLMLMQYFELVMGFTHARACNLYNLSALVQDERYEH
jgi:hypothetical protein